MPSQSATISSAVQGTLAMLSSTGWSPAAAEARPAEAAIHNSKTRETRMSKWLRREEWIQCKGLKASNFQIKLKRF